ncbi:hypothetical protein TNCV_3974011 [Trichonephila clavipes]|nr:hypothetical protein TNCV_3974011 [Trichonephila clavipes]
MATGSYLTPIYSRSQSEVQGDLHKFNYPKGNKGNKRTNVAVHNASVQHPLFTVSPDSIPTIVVLQTDA